jgi:hypothetical protein
MNSTQNLTFRKDIFTNISLKTIINNIAKRLEPSFNRNANITEVPKEASLILIYVSKILC